MDIFLHIGHFKTGTTAVQMQCADARAALREAGIAYPEDAGIFPHQHGATLSTLVRGQDAARRREAQDRLENWCGTPCERLVLSAETLVHVEPGRGAALIRDLKRHLRRHGRVHLIYTVRDWTTLLPSLYGMLVNSGDGLSWPDFLRTSAERFGTSALLNPSLVLSEYLRGEPDAVHVLHYTPDGAVRDVLNCFGVPYDLIEAAPRRNVSGSSRRNAVQVLCNRAAGYPHRAVLDAPYGATDIRQSLRPKAEQLLADELIGPELINYLEDNADTVAAEHRFDFAAACNALDAVCAEAGLPLCPAEWRNPPTESFWTGPSLRAERLTPVLAEAVK